MSGLRQYFAILHYVVEFYWLKFSRPTCMQFYPPHCHLSGFLVLKAPLFNSILVLLPNSGEKLLFFDLLLKFSISLSYLHTFLWLVLILSSSLRKAPIYSHISPVHKLNIRQYRLKLLWSKQLSRAMQQRDFYQAPRKSSAKNRHLEI